MSRKSVKFENKRVKKTNFYKSKMLFKIVEIDVDKILMSKKESYNHKKIYLNVLLSMMIKMSVDPYIYRSFPNDWVC